MPKPTPKLTPKSARALQSAMQLIEARQPFAAVRACESVMPRLMKHPDALRMYAIALCEAGDFGKALAMVDKAARLRPMDAAPRVAAGKILVQAGRYSEAIEQLTRLLEIEPRHTEAVDTLVDAHRRNRDPESAWAAVQRAIERGAAPDGNLAHALGEAAMGVGKPGEAIDAVRRAIAIEQQPQTVAAGLRFLLARLLDRAGEYDEAFAAFDAANAYVRSPFDTDQHRAAVDAMIDAWAEADLSPLPGHPEDEVVFIVGMPRSGTTLTEQILAAHPRVATAGETILLPDAAREAGVSRPPFTYPTDPGVLDPSRTGPAMVDFVRRLRAAAEGGPGAVLIDKLPVNAMFLPFAARCLPNARFIACTRDPRDIGLSCYQIFFTGGIRFAYDLEHIAHYTADTARFMEFMADRLPDRVAFAPYEQIVADLENHARRLSAHAGLEFDEPSLTFWETDARTRTASFDQVSRPIYTSSVGRWRRYERHLTPLIATLEARGVTLR